MKMNLFNYIVLIFIIVPLEILAQDSLSYTWIKQQTIGVDANAKWANDVLGNIYVASSGTINKFDLNGEMKYSQSIKSLGNTAQIVPVNTMKVILFSEEQQSLCYVDNTLTVTEDCLNLIEYNVFNASIICASGQPNKLWVMDNLNYSLILLSLDATNQRQEIKNLKGILEMKQVVKILERGNQLYLLDKDKGVYVFDIYGSLIQYIEQKGICDIDVYNNSLFCLMDDRVLIKMLHSGDTFTVQLPLSDIRSFSYINQSFLFRTTENVHNYVLQFDE